MTAEPTLLFCVGATKAGTSWVYEYLRGHPDCFLRGVKELHFFDRHDLGASWMMNDIRRQIESARSRIAAGSKAAERLKDKLVDLRTLRALLQGEPDEAAYLSFLSEGRGDRRLIADVTPSYSLLSAERLRSMAGLLPDVRFLYILRDPLDRLWSHIRMIARRKVGKTGDLAGAAAGVLDSLLAGGARDIAQRSDYRGALERLRSAVDPARLMVAFQEDLISAPGISGLCAFLGIADHAPDLGRRVHAGTDLMMTPAQSRAALAWLAPQYQFVQQTMQRVPASWQRGLTEV